ncbi:MAG: response regulator [Candidatus Lokiarchaeota archaeon]|nr:response regulator [Candidatus Lokiarchaeota archaeon]
MTRILIADDNSQNLYILEIILKAKGYEVESASNGADALDLARKNPPDLIITDILMPVMDGFELCRRWKTDALLKNIPFIFYSANYTESKDEQFALSLGAERFVVKPQQPEALIEVVQEILEEFKEGRLVPTETPLGEEIDFLHKHREVLLRKLEMKTQELDKELTKRKRTETDQRENAGIDAEDAEAAIPYYCLVIYKANGVSIFAKESKILSTIPKLDANLIAGMISGITCFLNEVLSGDQQLALLDRDNVKIMLEYSPHLIGILFSNKESRELRQQLGNLLQVTEQRLGPSIGTWTGDVKRFEIIDGLASKIMQ